LSYFDSDEVRNLAGVNRCQGAFLSYPDQPIRLSGAARWDKPKLDPKMVAGILRRIAIRDGADSAALYAQTDLPEPFSKPERP
jgi:hypothetical protein